MAYSMGFSRVNIVIPVFFSNEICEAVLFFATMREQAESGSEHDHNSYCGDTGLAVINEWKFSQLMDFSGFYAYIYIYVRVCTFFSFAAAPCFLFVAWVLCFLFFSFLFF